MKKLKSILTIDEKQFSKLCTLVKLGLLDDISNWFDEYIKNDEKLEKDLAIKILSNSYFFSFQSASFNKEYLNKETLMRELAILSKLKIQNQLIVLSSVALNDVNFNHFSVIDNNKENVDALLKSKTISEIITKLLHQEKFQDIDKINEKFDVNFLEMSSNRVTYAYEEKYSKGVSFLELKDNTFKPKYDIIFSFTKTKKEYLMHNNIELPTIEEAQKLQRDMLYELDNDSWIDRKEFREKIESFLKPYITHRTYENLNKDLPSTENKNIRLKI